MIRTRFLSALCEASPQRPFHFQRCLYILRLLNASVLSALQEGPLHRGPISCALQPIPLCISTSERQHVVSQAPARVLFCFSALFVFNCCCGGQLILLSPTFPPRSICNRTRLQPHKAATHTPFVRPSESAPQHRRLPLMPHHFKWINRATLLFNLAAAELLGGCVCARLCA